MSGHREVFVLFVDRTFVVVESGTEFSASLTYVGNPRTFGTHYAVQHILCVTCVVWGMDNIRLGKFDFAVCG